MNIPSIPSSLEGKNCLITGANSGLGKALAVELARKGASIIMGCRRNYDDELKEIQALSGNKSISLRLLNLSSLQETNQFCDGLRDDKVQLDIVLFNAGMAAGRNEITLDGYPLIWQVNFLANVVLTMRFLQDGVVPNSCFNLRNKQSTQQEIPRFIYTSSSRHREKLSIDFDHFGEIPSFSFRDTFKIYGLSKLYLMTFAWELGKRVMKNGIPEVSVFSFCPGAFRSRIGKNLGFIGNFVMSNILTSPENACWPGVYLASAPELDGKTQIYYHKRNIEQPDSRVIDQKNRELVWEKTMEILHRVSSTR